MSSDRRQGAAGSGGGAGQKPSAAKARARRQYELKQATKEMRARAPETGWSPWGRKGVARG